MYRGDPQGEEEEGGGCVCLCGGPRTVSGFVLQGTSRLVFATGLPLVWNKPSRASPAGQQTPELSPPVWDYKHASSGLAF